MTSVRAYYWPEVPNFGDRLTPLLLKRFAGLDSKWEPIHRAEVVSTGSLLEHIPPYWDGHILGTGKLFGDSRLSLYTYTARLWALRGPLSASGVSGDYAIGDPGLLADELVAGKVETRDIDLGILPHWTDGELATRPDWYGKWRTEIIDPVSDPLVVLTQVGRCKRLVTSSLHGMIAADAFGIPRRLEYCASLDREGGKFKFLDYSKSINCKLEFGRAYAASRFHVEDRKHEIYDAFEAFGRYICSQQALSCFLLQLFSLALSA